MEAPSRARKDSRRSRRAPPASGTPPPGARTARRTTRRAPRAPRASPGPPARPPATRECGRPSAPWRSGARSGRPCGRVSGPRTAGTLRTPPARRATPWARRGSEPAHRACKPAPALPSATRPPTGRCPRRTAGPASGRSPARAHQGDALARLEQEPEVPHGPAIRPGIAEADALELEPAPDGRRHGPRARLRRDPGPHVEEGEQVREVQALLEHLRHGEQDALNQVAALAKRPGEER